MTERMQVENKRYFWWLVDRIWPSDMLFKRADRKGYLDRFPWLFDMAGHKVAGYYYDILITLYRIPYYWDEAIEMDENREDDGLLLREMYNDEDAQNDAFDIGPCTCLEMLTALAMRCDIDDMGDPDYPYLTAPLWFWSMIENTGLLRKQYSVNDILGTIKMVLNRQYDAVGHGSFFPNEDSQDDMRETDIFMQMRRWCMHQFGVEFEV